MRHRLIGWVPVVPLLLVVAAFTVATTPAPALAVTPLPTLAADDPLLTTEQEAWLDERDRTVVLGTDSTYKPYVFFGDGGLSGITGDYVDLLEERLDITIRARPLPGFTETLDAVEAREIDIVPNLVFSEDRPFLVFTEVFITVVDRIVVRSDDTADYGLADLGGRRVASTDGYAVTDDIEADFPDIDIVRVATEVDGMQLLSTGAVDVLVADLGVVSFAVQEENITNLRVAGTVDSVSEQRFGVRSDQPILRDILDAGLATITDAEREEIADRWIQLGSTESSNTGPLFLGDGHRDADRVGRDRRARLESYVAAQRRSQDRGPAARAGRAPTNRSAAVPPRAGDRTGGRARARRGCGLVGSVSQSGL